MNAKALWARAGCLSVYALVLILVAAGAAWFGATWGAQKYDRIVQSGEPSPAPVAPRGDLSNFERTTTKIFRETSPSVVYITTLALRQGLFRRNVTAIPRGTGTGFVWDRRGHVVTNYHVVQEANAAKVSLSDGSVWDAELVGYYDDKDIAVLRIQAQPQVLKPVKLGTSGDLEVGQNVFAIGNPFGLDHTLSTGVVSAVGREIRSIGGRPIQGAIQTDAAINPGNSGGPLLDSAGRVIGVNTQIYSPSGASVGVGFAVPIDTVNRVVPQLIQHGRVTRPVIGVEIDEGRLAAQIGLKGAMVLSVTPGSGAEKAGIRPARIDRRTGGLVVGDVIVSVDRKPIGGAEDVYRVLDVREAGETVDVEVVRDGKSRVLKVVLTGVVDQ